jgi:hypothetical protein
MTMVAHWPNCGRLYELSFTLYGEPGISRDFSRFTVRKHSGLISHFQISREEHGVLYHVNLGLQKMPRALSSFPVESALTDAVLCSVLFIEG